MRPTGLRPKRQVLSLDKQLPDGRSIWAYACLLSGMLLVGTYVGLSKPLAAAIPVFLLALLRFAIAAVIMLPWSFGPQLSRSTWFILLVQSFFGNFLFSICMLYGIQMSSAVAAGVIMASLPAVIAVASWMVLKEHLHWRTWLAVIISVISIGVLQIAQSFAPVNSASLTEATNSGFSKVIIGNLLLFAAVCCEAIYVLLGKRLVGAVSPKRNAALINLFGLVLMLPFGVLQLADFSFSALSPSIWALLGFYAFAASVGSTWLFLTGLKSIPASEAGVFTIGLPIAAALVGVFWLNEPFTWAHAVAFLGCVIAIGLVSRKSS